MMNKAEIQQELDSLLTCLKDIGQPVSVGVLGRHIGGAFNAKTLQRRLKRLVESGEVIAEGERKSRTYRVTSNTVNDVVGEYHSEQADDKPGASESNAVSEVSLLSTHPVFSENALKKLNYLDTPTYGRVKTTYQAKLLQDYIPNNTQYVPSEVRARLHNMGKRIDKHLAAGTYAKQIGQRLLIDLSYNSSRLEGNTYSRLDTQKLIEQGLSADGKIHEETIMIMNHKEAIEFLIENAEDISLSAFTVRNIHYLLSQDLLNDPTTCGKEREIEVTIGKSAYIPLNNAYQIKEYLMLLLLKAEQIDDPFEQSFFLLMHLSYLQAFVDVNKRTARLTCNIPFVKQNLCPMSFIDVPQDDYVAALLYFYETNDVLPALELFEWAYTKSCEQYEMVKESLGEIDVYRIQHRAARKKAMGQVIRHNIKGDKATAFLKDFCKSNHIAQPEKFIAMAVTDLAQLHEGAIIGLGITEAMFATWRTSE